MSQESEYYDPKRWVVESGIVLVSSIFGLGLIAALAVGLNEAYQYSRSRRKKVTA